MAKINPEFIDKVKVSEEFNAAACMNCGVCSVLCPLGIDILPRTLFRYVLLGLEDKVIENSHTIFSCLLCKMCEENCSGDVQIAQNVHVLRRYMNKEVNKF